jgi:glutathione S-transferase
MPSRLYIPGVPTIVDHDNEDFVIWESNAIARYLVDRYDKKYTIHFPPGTKESYILDQWLDFQASTQV